MPQMHLYLPKELADEVKRRAEKTGSSVSGYLAEIVRSRVADEWPAGFFKAVVGGWTGDPLKRQPQPSPEARDRIEGTGARTES